MVFIIDLPKLSEADQKDPEPLTPFGQDMCFFLKAQGLDEGLVSSLKNYDFTETRHYGFVHTM